MTDLATDPTGTLPAGSEALLARLRAANVQRVLYPLVQRLNRTASAHGTIRDYTKPAKPDLCSAILATWPADVIEADLATVESGAVAMPAVPADGASDAAGRALQALREALGPSRTAVDENAVRAIVADALTTERDGIVAAAMEAARSAATVTFHVVAKEGAPAVDCGVQHAEFPRLLRICQTRDKAGHRHVPLLVGPPGTGKTSAARAVAKALALPRFAFTGALDSEYALTGFIDAGGRIVSKPFRECWEHGGVFLFDEFFASVPGAAVAVNAMLGNGIAAFPDGLIPRHADNVCVVCDNTNGTGGGARFAGRVRHDDSVRDRVVPLAWPIDPALERAMAHGPLGQRWLAAVLAARTVAESRGMHHVTPRATARGADTLAAFPDTTFDDVAEEQLRAAVAAESWAPILEAARRAWDGAS